MVAGDTAGGMDQVIYGDPSEDPGGYEATWSFVPDVKVKGFLHNFRAQLATPYPTTGSCSSLSKHIKLRAHLSSYTVQLQVDCSQRSRQVHNVPDYSAQSSPQARCQHLVRLGSRIGQLETLLAYPL
ncbi:uncharacterized protein DSM5745_10469 [Aspergillus mulundensis]|uniref:Uncharacterized protein n=1 Tax=Aspergillus mulundensis TaxID=1810919 RepID=A0A3D8QJ73_9EURO|nr:hypothetical protein DSM5745_10469 [Aspergillus mulundensis]RDW61797.1 hypothetical protein DSM5745_10469 [Aspergillus mulundensis]